MQLNVPKTQHKEFGARTFSVFGSKTWNQLPKDLRTICSYDTLNVNITLKHIILKSFLCHIPLPFTTIIYLQFYLAAIVKFLQLK